MDEYKVSFRAARVNCNLTLKKAAEETGVSLAALQRYESNSGDIPLVVAKKLMNLYGIPSFKYIRID